MSEAYSLPPEAVPLDPVMLIAGFKSYAHEIERPEDRAMAFASFASLIGDLYPESREQCVVAAKEALHETMTAAAAQEYGSGVEFSGHRLLRMVASLTLDEEVIAQVEGPARNDLLVQLAVKRGDASLVPADPASQDKFKGTVALRTNDIELARTIDDPLQRAKALAAVLDRLSCPDSDGGIDDPSYILALENETWQALRAVPLEERFFPNDLVYFAVKRGPRFILDIPHTKGRLAAVRDYGLAALHRGDAEGVDWCKRQFAVEMAACETRQEHAEVVEAIAHYAPKAGDPELALLIPDAFPDKQEAALYGAAVQRAINDKDAETLVAMRPSFARDWALKDLAVKNGDNGLVPEISSAGLQLEAVSEIAGKRNAQGLKDNVVRLILLDSLAGLTLSRQGVNYANVAVNLGDPEAVRPLFEKDALPSLTLKEIALRLKSADLAHLIRDEPVRARALVTLAGVLNRAPLIESSNASPALKAEAYQTLFFHATD